MAIINRELDVTQKRVEFCVRIPATTSGASVLLMTVPWNARFAGAFQSAVGISGSPVHNLKIARFDGGETVLNGFFATLAVTAFGVSGSQGYSALGQSLSLRGGDIVVLEPGGANSNVAHTTITLVLECLDDYKKTFSV